MQFSLDGYHFRVHTDGCPDDRAIIEIFLDWNDQWVPLGIMGLVRGETHWIPCDLLN